MAPGAGPDEGNERLGRSRSGRGPSGGPAPQPQGRFANGPGPAQLVPCAAATPPLGRLVPTGSLGWARARWRRHARSLGAVVAGAVLAANGSDADRHAGAGRGRRRAARPALGRVRLRRPPGLGLARRQRRGRPEQRLGRRHRIELRRGLLRRNGSPPARSGSASSSSTGSTSTRGWIGATWNGNGADMYATAPGGLAKQPQGSISFLSPGDVVSYLSPGGVEPGHAGIVNAADPDQPRHLLRAAGAAERVPVHHRRPVRRQADDDHPLGERLPRHRGHPPSRRHAACGRGVRTSSERQLRAQPHGRLALPRRRPGAPSRRARPRRPACPKAATCSSSEAPRSPARSTRTSPRRSAPGQSYTFSIWARSASPAKVHVCLVLWGIGRGRQAGQTCAVLGPPGPSCPPPTT